MKNSKRNNPTVSTFILMTPIIIFIMVVTMTVDTWATRPSNANFNVEDLIFSYSENYNGTDPNRYNLPDNLRPAFESMPIWRLQLRVKTAGKKNANTDSEAYVKFTPSKTSIYYLDNAGDDREKNKVDTYDILDPNVRTMRDIKMLQLSIKGKDGWCIKSIEVLVNDIKQPVFIKKYNKGKWLDGNGHNGPTMHFSGKTLRKSARWGYTKQNKSIWLPPLVIKRATLEQMVESYVGHMMNSIPEMRKLEFGKKYGRAYVEAKKAGGNKLKFDLDLAYHKGIDFEMDVDFELVTSCSNNKINLKAQSVKGKLNIPVVSKLVRVFKKKFGKMDMGNFNFGNANVPFCPNIKVKNNGDISIRP